MDSTFMNDRMFGFRILDLDHVKNLTREEFFAEMEYVPGGMLRSRKDSNIYIRGLPYITFQNPENLLKEGLIGIYREV